MFFSFFFVGVKVVGVCVGCQQGGGSPPICGTLDPIFEGIIRL